VSMAIFSNVAADVSYAADQVTGAAGPAGVFTPSGG